MWYYYIFVSYFPKNKEMSFYFQGQRSHSLAIFVAILILMMLLILYGSNNSPEAIYPPFHVAENHALKTTDLKRWSGKDDYVPLYGNKVCLTTNTVNAGASVWPEMHILFTLISLHSESVTFVTRYVPINSREGLVSIIAAVGKSSQNVWGIKVWLS